MERDDVYDFGAAGEVDDAKGGGARFLSVENDGWQPEGESKDIMQKLAEKAAAAVQARKPKVKTRLIKARFGGARATLNENDGGSTEANAFDKIEKEFVQELDDNVPQSFLPAADIEDDDEHDDDETRAAPFFFTDDVWEDIDYNQRKQNVVERLEEVGERVSRAQVALPQIKVENDRLQHDCRKLEREAQDLKDQERKIFQRHPDFKKKYLQQGQGGANEEEDIQAAKGERDNMNAEEKRERERQAKQLKARMIKRRSIAMQGLSEVEENERDKGEVLVQDSDSLLSSALVAIAILRLSLAKYASVLDPYRLPIAWVRTQMPRAVPYFRVLRRVNLVNMLFLGAALPQMLQWIRGKKEGEFYHGFCSDDTLIMPCAVRYSSIQRYLWSDRTDLGLLYIYLFSASYVLVYLATMKWLFHDFYVNIRADIFQVDSDPYKFSKLVFNAWNCRVFSPAEQRAIRADVMASLALLRARREEEGAPEGEEPEEDENASPYFDDEHEHDELRLAVVRYVGLVMVMGTVVGAWIVLDVFGPTSLEYYPLAWQRLVAPIVCAVFNQWIAPAMIRYWIVQAKIPKTQHATFVLLLMFTARLVNIVIILRRQLMLLSDTERVFRPDELRDTCFCEDEVGANFVYFWTCDWAASLLKVIIVPLFHRLYHRIQQTHRIRLGGRWVAAWRPSFEISSWLIDVVYSQLLFLFSLPLFPTASILVVAMGFITFFVQRVAVVHLWEAPKNVVYDPRRIRLSFSICQSIALHGATLVYFYLWVYGATDAWTAPICKLPLLHQNATGNGLCTFDPATGIPVSTTPCLPTAVKACRRTCEKDNNCATSSALFVSLYPSESPAAMVSERLRGVLSIVGAPVLAWLCTTLLFLRYIVQNQYRKRFDEYVQEQRFRLLIKLSNLERSLKKQEKILEIQSQY